MKYIKSKRPSRRFLGEMPTKENSTENKFRKAHLKAYLKGKEIFNFGFLTDNFTQRKYPETHVVKQEFK